MLVVCADCLTAKCKCVNPKGNAMNVGNLTNNIRWESKPVKFDDLPDDMVVGAVKRIKDLKKGGFIRLKSWDRAKMIKGITLLGQNDKVHHKNWGGFLITLDDQTQFIGQPEQIVSTIVQRNSRK